MPSTYIRLLAQDFPDHERLARASGIEPSALAAYARSVTVAQHLQCVRNAVAMAAEPDWHLRWGQRMAENFHGPVTLAMLSAPTLGDGLDAFVRHIPSRVPYHAWRRIDARGCARFEVNELIDLETARCTLVEVPLIVMYEYVRIFQPGDLGDAAIELVYERPPHAHCLPRWFACPVHFGRVRNALLIPRAWLALRNLNHDEAAWYAALERCEAMRPTDEPADIASDIARLINEHMESAVAPSSPTVAEIAAGLKISSRTLIRRLRQRDTTYRAILDEVLKRRARELMGSGEYPVHEVARRLGYSDPKSFRRAFKRWYGMTPQNFRNLNDEA